MFEGDNSIGELEVRDFQINFNSDQQVKFRLELKKVSVELFYSQQLKILEITDQKEGFLQLNGLYQSQDARLYLDTAIKGAIFQIELQSITRLINYIVGQVEYLSNGGGQALSYE